MGTLATMYAKGKERKLNGSASIACLNLQLIFHTFLEGEGMWPYFEVGGQWQNEQKMNTHTIMNNEIKVFCHYHPNSKYGNVP